MFYKKLFNKQSSIPESITERMEIVKSQAVPGHVAIIMDGNGRWAKSRALPRIAGHHEGMKVVRKIAILANNIGIQTLTLFAFSTENWKRPKSEVDYLMKLPAEFLDIYLPELIDNNVKVQVIGEKEKIPSHTLLVVEKAIERTKNNDGLLLNFALNYGSRSEIIMAIKNIVKDIKCGNMNERDLNEDVFSQYLMTKDLADPDLLIRTSGEIRLSNFMLWQSAYTELWFTDCLWPDFDEEHFLDAIEQYQKRSRRFGGI
jgi:undecaprenyl diphosphate synthase